MHRGKFIYLFTDNSQTGLRVSKGDAVCLVPFRKKLLPLSSGKSENSSILKMVAASSEILVTIYQNARCNVPPEDLNINYDCTDVQVLSLDIRTES